MTAERYADERLEVVAADFEETDTFTLYVCSDCGSVVRSQTIHDRWHAAAGVR